MANPQGIQSVRWLVQDEQLGIVENCLSETAVFHETLSAPNQEGRATRYAAWSPAESDPERAAEFRRRLGLEE